MQNIIKIEKIKRRKIIHGENILLNYKIVQIPTIIIWYIKTIIQQNIDSLNPNFLFNHADNFPTMISVLNSKIPYNRQMQSN